MPADRPAVMGILNVTPDSFSDGGKFFHHRDAIDHGLKMMDEGADWIDVGGESTRPGAEPVSADEELLRVLPVVKALAQAGARVSIDTSKAAVAKPALAEGAHMVNDVTALGDADMAKVCVDAGCGLCLMHMQGTPREMQNNPTYDDVVREVVKFLGQRSVTARAAGVAKENIWIDPGIGFGKTVDHNLRLIRGTDVLASLGYPVLIGLSRKSFLAKISTLDLTEIADRDEGGIALQTIAQSKGARVFRVHNVARTRRAADAVAALLAGS